MANADGSIIFSTEIDNKKHKLSLINWKRK